MAANEVVPFEALARDLAATYQVEPAELIATVKSTCFPNGAATDAQLMMMLSFARTYDLNPLARECYAFVSSGKMTVGVQVDGFSKIANRQENYDGQEMEYEKNDKGEVIAITSKTYVKGRRHPTTYRAEMSEWKRATDVWKQMPCHQLYVKARNQGIRFAFGIPAYDPDDIERIAASRGSIETTATEVKEQPKLAVVKDKKPKESAPASNSTTPSPVSETPAATAPQATTPPVSAPVPSENFTPTVYQRNNLKKLMESLPVARANLLLTQAGVATIDEMDDAQVAATIAKIESRKGK